VENKAEIGRLDHSPGRHPAGTAWPVNPYRLNHVRRLAADKRPRGTVFGIRPVGITNLRSNSVSRPTMTCACESLMIHNMTKHKRRATITLLGSTAILVLTVGCSGSAGGELSSGTTTTMTTTTSRGPFAGLTQLPQPPATAGSEATAPSHDDLSAD
jgi:hypothetical protein